MPSLGEQIAFLFVLAIPVACIAWTITHEEIFREAREFCKRNSEECRRLLQRKFFYLFTCEFCFSYWVTLLFLFVTRFKLLYPDWRGYVISAFSLVWVANMYMNFFGRVRLEIRKERAEIASKEEVAQSKAGR